MNAGIKIIHHQIDGLVEIKLDNFTDNRGEIWSIYEECDLLPKFVEDKVTISKKNFLRSIASGFGILKTKSMYLYGHLTIIRVGI